LKLFCLLLGHIYSADPGLLTAWKQLFYSTWKDFQASFKPILSDFQRHRELLDCSASLVQIQESRDARLHAQETFATLAEERIRTNMLTVINWLSAADPSEDQEACTAVRQDIHDTGRWILKEPIVKDWLDPDECSVNIFWLNGIPGAGEFNFPLIRGCKNLRS
jgi:hypothetical protein